MTEAWLRRWAHVVAALWLLAGAASAQVTVPTLGTRGTVPDRLVETVTAGLRAGLVEAGFVVQPGDLITAGIAGSLEPEFTRLIGEAPMRSLARWRMQVAAERLRNSAAPLARIAVDVGYESEAAFSRAFKKAYGKAPALWRREQG